MSSLTTTILADTLIKVEECISDLLSLNFTGLPQCIAVDLEGVELSRRGRVSVVQLKANHSSTIWLLDITVLGQAAFDHPNASGLTIRDILQAPTVKKIFYDVRRDADALYNLYGIDMKNVYDIQIVELAVRKSNNKYTPHLNGLARSINDYLPFNGAEWTRVKDRGIQLFSRQKGGSYEVFEQRPLDPALIAYSAQDVSLLSALEAMFMSLMGSFQSNGYTWDHRIRAASEHRLNEAKSPVFDEEGRHRAIAPRI